VFANYGPISGRRWRFGVGYGPDLKDGGALFENASVDFRQYLLVTDRSNFAVRAFAGVAEGNRPSPFYFGGLDTLRGFGFRRVVGDRAFFTNLEYRFPLIDVVATPVLAFRGVRGVIFVDVGGAWYNDFESFDFWDSDEHRLRDGLASYGWGLSTQFLGLELNWDFARRWDFKDASDFETSFWIGTRF
jgi:outer membrane protein assembly factor BamA